MNKLLIILLIASCSKPIAETKMERITQEEGNPIIELQEIEIRRTSTIANDFNNPGCIRPGNPKLDALAIGWCNTTNGKFLVFDLPDHGFMALQIWIRDRAKWVLSKAIKVYAPKEDKNNPTAYINKLCSNIGCTPSTKLEDINEMQLISAIAEKEGFNN